MARRGTAASRCPAYDKRRRAGRAGRQAPAPAPLRALLLSRLCLTAALAGREQPRWLEAIFSSAASGPRKRPVGARGISSPSDRTAPPAGPATFPGLTASAGSSAPAPRQRQDRSERDRRPLRSSGLSALHKPKSAWGEGGRECLPLVPVKASSRPSKAGHAGQPGLRSELQGPEDQDESEPRRRFTRSAAPTLPSSETRADPGPPSRPLAKFARRTGRVRGSTWDRRRAKRSPAVLKDARRAETTGPTDSASSSSSSGCRPCPPAALRGRSPLCSATGRCRGSAAPPHGPAARQKVCAAQTGGGSTARRSASAGPCRAGELRAEASPAGLGPRPLPLPPSYGAEPRGQRGPRRGRDRGRGASRRHYRQGPKGDCSTRRPGLEVPHALSALAPTPPRAHPRPRRSRVRQLCSLPLRPRPGRTLPRCFQSHSVETDLRSPQ